MRKIELKMLETIRNQRDAVALRDDVETVTYHRPATKAEINIGFGAIHYADFETEDCCHKGTRILKKWFVSQHDGLRYYKG